MLRQVSTHKTAYLMHFILQFLQRGHQLVHMLTKMLLQFATAETIHHLFSLLKERR